MYRWYIWVGLGHIYIHTFIYIHTYIIYIYIYMQTCIVLFLLTWIFNRRPISRLSAVVWVSVAQEHRQPSTHLSSPSTNSRSARISTSQVNSIHAFDICLMARADNRWLVRRHLWRYFHVIYQYPRHKEDAVKCYNWGIEGWVTYGPAAAKTCHQVAPELVQATIKSHIESLSLFSWQNLQDK